jgi:hypothetical protein
MNNIKKLILAGVMLFTLIPTITITLRKHKVACNTKPDFIEL